jgi:23S rRNA (cytosine1962-C5)-methyltransferase
MEPDRAPADRVPAGRPVVRLRPRAPAQAIRFGAPWAYVDHVVLDRRTRAIPPGTVVCLEDAERRALGAAAFNPASKIAVRMLDRDPAAVIDASWFASRLSRALALRERLYDAPFYRLVHAEVDGLPGVVIDRFGDAAVVQPNAAWAEARVDGLADALVGLTGVAAVVRNGLGRARTLEGLGSGIEQLVGAIAGPVRVAMNGATYFADLLGGQKTGLYFDQRRTTPSPRAGARRATCSTSSPMSAGSGSRHWRVGRRARSRSTARRPRLRSPSAARRRPASATRFAVRRGDAFAAMAALAEEGRRFGLVVADPPAFAQNEAGARSRACAPTSGSRASARRWSHAGRLPRPLLVQPCRRPLALPRCEFARHRARRTCPRRSCTPGLPGPTIRSTRISPRAPISRRSS